MEPRAVKELADWIEQQGLSARIVEDREEPGVEGWIVRTKVDGRTLGYKYLTAGGSGSWFEMGKYGKGRKASIEEIKSWIRYATEDQRMSYRSRRKRAKILGGMTEEEIRSEYGKGRKIGLGFNPDDEIDTWEYLGGINGGLEVYETPSGDIVGVGDVHGPWAITLREGRTSSRELCADCKRRSSIHDDPTEDARQIAHVWEKFADKVADSPVVGRSMELLSGVDGVTDDLEEILRLLESGSKADEASAVRILELPIDTIRDEIVPHLERERQGSLSRQADNLLARMEQLRDDLAARNRLR